MERTVFAKVLIKGRVAISRWLRWEEIVLRYRMPSSPIYLSDVINLFASSRGFLLFSGGKSVLLVKEKAPSRSGFPLSMHVVLKTRYVNLNIHVRRY